MKIFRIKLLVVLTLSTILFSTSCKETPPDTDKETLILIETSLGNISIKLYNETPLHRDNMIKLIEEDYYDGTIFHRVINTFMIQGGDHTSKNALNQSVNYDSIYNYVIDAEIVPNFYHKRGALAAARMPDSVNPLKKSSGTQFYIVQGKVFSDDELASISARINQNTINNIHNNIIMDKANKLIDKGINPDFAELQISLKDTINGIVKSTPMHNFTDEQLNIYTTIGGSPHLDGDYTIYGEVVEGLEVVDKIAAVNTGEANKPLKDITIKMSIIKK